MSRTTFEYAPDRQIPVVVDRETPGFSLSIRLYDAYQQIVDFRLPGVAILGMDERPPTGHGWGPSPAHLIGASLGAALGARLLSRLRERGIEVRALRTNVSGTFATDAEAEGDTQRIARIAVRLVPVVDSPAGSEMPVPEMLLRESGIARSLSPGIELQLTIAPEAPARVRPTASPAPIGATLGSRSALGPPSGPLGRGAA